MIKEIGLLREYKMLLCLHVLKTEKEILLLMQWKKKNSSIYYCFIKDKFIT